MKLQIEEMKTGSETLVKPSSWDENKEWNGRPEDFAISSCNLVVPFASTTLKLVRSFEFSMGLISTIHEKLLAEFGKTW